MKNQKNNKTQEREQLLSLSMGKLFKRLAIPGIIGMVVIGLYNLMDAVFVGQLIGKEAVGAVALVFSVVAFNQGILLLVGSGSMSMLSIALGKKDHETIDKLLGNMIVSIFIMSGIYSVFVYYNTEWIVSFIGGAGLIAELATRYLRIISIGMIFAALGPAMNFLIRGEGKMKAAMYFAGGASLLNIILNPIFISTFGMGIEGAAIATITSQIIYIITQFIFFGKGKSVIALQKVKLKLEKSLLPNIFKVGSAQLIMMTMATIQQIILFRSLQHYGGGEHVVIMGASYRTFMFAYIALWGIAQGMQPAIGVNYGAGKMQRVKKIFISFTLYGLIVSSALWIVFMIVPGVILGTFITDPIVVKNGIPLFRILNIIFFGYIYFSTSINLYIGLGKGKEAGILATARQIAFFIPLVLILPRMLGAIGVWIALPLADLFTMCVAIIFQKNTFSTEKSKKRNIEGFECCNKKI